MMVSVAGCARHTHHHTKNAYTEGAELQAVCFKMLVKKFRFLDILKE
jgi:hypothetical protein